MYFKSFFSALNYRTKGKKETKFVRSMTVDRFERERCTRPNSMI